MPHLMNTTRSGRVSQLLLHQAYATFNEHHKVRQGVSAVTEPGVGHFAAKYILVQICAFYQS